MIAALGVLDNIITDPVAREELMSVYGNDASARRGDSDGEEMWSMYIGLCVAVGALFMFIVVYISLLKCDVQEKYNRLSKLRLTTAVVSVLFLFLPLPAFLLLLWQMKRLRNKASKCPRCSTRMRRVTDPAEIARWLTPGQATETRLNSVLHDVWLCPACHYGMVRSYPNPSSQYVECSHCGAKAARLVSDNIVRPATYSVEGEGVRTYHCENCGNQTHKRYRLPRRQRPVVVIGGIGGRGGGFGGGGFGGGSFGGGMTGGGGASGRW